MEGDGGVRWLSGVELIEGITRSVNEEKIR